LENTLPNYRRPAVLSLLVFLFLARHLESPVVFADDWRPITQEELKMTSLPEAPGAAAVILYRQVDQVDKVFTESKQINYVRVKILTEAGRSYGNVEIAFEKGAGDISSIRARTIHPDGSIVNFDGKVSESTIVKAKGLHYTAKVFAMPEVQAGSVLDYQYVFTLSERNNGSLYQVRNSEWLLNSELFTRMAKFSMNAYTEHGLRVAYSWPAGLPAGAKPPEEGGDGIIRMEAKNIPALVPEDYMPPMNELRQRVIFNYHDGSLETDPEKFWKAYARKEYGQVEGFLGKPAFLARITAETISAGGPSEDNLRKLYERVQKFRNLTYELQKAPEQMKQENLKTAVNAEELWNSAYGHQKTLNWLFLGMARAAGFTAYPLRVSNRQLYFFNKARMNAQELSFTAVLVKLNGQDLILDPGAYLAPFGLLPWEETGVPALQIDKDGDTWLETNLGTGGVTRTVRVGDFKLSEDGTLEGSMRVTFTGQVAFAHRIDQMRASDADRKKALEEEIRASIPLASEVELTKSPDWTSSAPALVAEFHTKVPGWATSAGKNLLLPVGLFSSGEKQTFVPPIRQYSIYFEYPFDHFDDFRVRLPAGWKVAGVPKTSGTDLKAAKYVYSFNNSDSAVNIHRELKVQFVLMESQFYPALRSLFQSLKTKDEEQVVLQRATEGD
jgi:Domain of Unknown Function with PDB structure (DUF3857)